MLLAGLLLNHDFVGFETHLKSLVQFYNQATNNCDPSKMYRALSAMEAVLITINERRLVSPFILYYQTTSYGVI